MLKGKLFSVYLLSSIVLKASIHLSISWPPFFFLHDLNIQLTLPELIVYLHKTTVNIKTRCVGTTRMSPPWILRRFANISPFFNSLSNRIRITNEFQSWSVTYDYTVSYQKSSQYLKSKWKKGNAKRGVSPRLKIWPGDLDLWPMTLKINWVPDSLMD